MVVTIQMKKYNGDLLRAKLEVDFKCRCPGTGDMDEYTATVIYTNKRKFAEIKVFQKFLEKLENEQYWMEDLIIIIKDYFLELKPVDLKVYLRENTAGLRYDLQTV